MGVKKEYRKRELTQGQEGNRKWNHGGNEVAQYSLQDAGLASRHIGRFGQVQLGLFDSMGEE